MGLSLKSPNDLIIAHMGLSFTSLHVAGFSKFRLNTGLSLPSPNHLNISCKGLSLKSPNDLIISHMGLSFTSLHVAGFSELRLNTGLSLPSPNHLIISCKGLSLKSLHVAGFPNLASTRS